MGDWLEINHRLFNDKSRSLDEVFDLAKFYLFVVFFTLFSNDTQYVINTNMCVHAVSVKGKIYVVATPKQQRVNFTS